MKSIIPLLFILLTTHVSVAADFVVEKNSKCKVFVKPSEINLNVYWHGPCKNGFAEGLGVARYLSGNKVESVYYGIMKAGYWSSGVYDVQGGYVTGNFKDNEQVDVKDKNGVADRNVIIGAFGAAAKAASQLSAEFEKSGNKASAKYYKSEADRLSQQMD